MENKEYKHEAGEKRSAQHMKDDQIPAESRKSHFSSEHKLTW